MISSIFKNAKTALAPIAAAGAMIGAAAPAYAATNLFQNGSFEDPTNPQADWNFGSRWGIVTGGPDADNVTAETTCVGAACLIPGDPGAAELTQSVSLVAGQTYNFSVFLESFLTPSEFVAYIGNQKILDVVNAAGQTYSSSFVADTTGLNVFKSLGRDDPGEIKADQFVLTPASTPGIPEPSTWALSILGTGLVGAALRRRRPTLEAAPK